MEKKWILRRQISLEFKKQFPEIPDLILQLLYNRGLKTQKQIDEFLNPDYGQDILDPFLFPDMEKAVERIYQAIGNKEQIAIHGDYDADGVTSSVLIVEVLQKLGANLFVYIPHREKEGYGLNKKTIKYLARKKVKLIITVDCGISNLPEIFLAKKMGMEVIVTDHHNQPPKMPNAYAIINPKIKIFHYPCYDLAGCGVAFKLAQAIISKDKNNIFPVGYEKWLLDLVAIGTVTDVMPLLGENRALVTYGLIVLNKTKRLGLKLLAQKARVLPISEEKLINSENIGFALGPRLNAAGRMDHANSAFELLMTEKHSEAERLVNNLENNNQKRQALTEKIMAEVLKEIKDIDKQLLVLAHGKKWPLGVIGLAAGKLKDQYNRPVVIISQMGKKIVGSGRSIDEFNLIEALNKVADCFEVYGGHAGAAGFTLKNKKALPEFEKRFKKIVEADLKGKDLTPKLEIEAELNLEDLNWELFDQIEKFEPFGMGNPKPIFLVSNLRVENVRTVGNGNKHLKIFVRHEKMIKSFEAIGFGMGEMIGHIKYGDRVEVVCEINLNEFNGERKLELRLVDLKKVGEMPIGQRLKSKIL